ncbi:ankyrin [Hypoxylon cercidicola]|nr:ankyrin [Hypoxylon cercidicola]
MATSTDLTAWSEGGAKPELGCMPTELLVIIASFCGPESATDFPSHLKSLTLVNRRLHCIFDEELWRFDQKYGPVRWAIFNHRIDILEKALVYNLDFGSALLGEPIHDAVGVLNNSALSWLLDHGVPVDGNEVNSALQSRDVIDVSYSPLHTALCAENQIAAIFLLSRGATYRFEDPTQWVGEFLASALHKAVRARLHLVVKYLVKMKGADPNETIQDGSLLKTPLHLAIDSYYNKKVIRKLLALGADINGDLRPDLTPPLTYAFQLGRYYYARLLLKAGAEVTPKNITDTIPSPLMACIVDYSTNGRWCPSALFSDIIGRIVQKGPDLERSFEGNTPLTAAIENDCPTPLFAALLKAGADPQKPRELDNKTPIEVVWSSLNSPWDNVTRKASLLAAAGARLDTIDPKTGRPYLLDAIDGVLRTNNRERLGRLLHLAARHNELPVHLNKLLEGCLHGRNLFSSQVLIHHGATSPEAKDLAFSWAQELIGKRLRDVNYEAMSFCLDLGLDTDQLESLFRDALCGVHIENCHILIGRGVLSLSKEFRPWLHLAARHGWTSLVQQFHKAGMDVNALDDDFGTPLLRALEASQTNTAELLFQLGADPFHPRSDAECRRMANTSTQVISPVELALRGNHLRLARKWWLGSLPDARPTEEFYIPRVLARGPLAHGYMESLRRRTGDGSAEAQDGDDQERTDEDTYKNEEEAEKNSKLDNALAYIQKGGLEYFDEDLAAEPYDEDRESDEMDW